MAAYIEDDELLQALADTLKRDAAKLEPYWSRIVARANLDAYHEIVGALANRGYSSSVIAAWDRGPTYQLSLGLFWCGVHGAAHFMANEGELLAEFDRREELETVPITVDGELQTPLVSATGPISSGAMRTSREVFRAWRRNETTRELEQDE